MKRRPEGSQWDREFLDACKGCPWDKTGADEEKEGIQIPVKEREKR